MSCPYAAADTGFVEESTPATSPSCAPPAASAPKRTLPYLKIRTYVAPGDGSHSPLHSSQNVNGFDYVKVGGWLVFPRFGVEVRAVGSLAQKALATLTYSPRARLALGSSSAPSSWKTVTDVLSSETITVEVPRSWPVAHSTSPYGICRAFAGWVERDLSTAVTLSTDSTSYHCPSLSIPSYPVAPSLWVRLDVRQPNLGAKQLQFSAEGSSRCAKVNTLELCPATTPIGEIYFARVFVLGSRTSFYVELGLNGDGSVDSEILDSLTATRAQAVTATA